MPNQSSSSQQDQEERWKENKGLQTNQCKLGSGRVQQDTLEATSKEVHVKYDDSRSVEFGPTELQAMTMTSLWTPYTVERQGHSKYMVTRCGKCRDTAVVEDVIAQKLQKLQKLKVLEVSIILPDWVAFRPVLATGSSSRKNPLGRRTLDCV